MNEKFSFDIRITLASILIICCAAYVLHMPGLQNLEKHKSVFAYENVPLLTTADGYHYLRITEEMEAGTYSIKKDPLRPYQAQGVYRFPPLLSSFTASLASVLGMDSAVLAYYLPPFLVAITALGALLWSSVLGSVGGGLAGLLMLAGVGWLQRSTLGKFDTDCLNLFFTTIICYSAYRFATGQTRTRFLWLAGLFAASALFFVWWQNGCLLVFAIAGLCYTLSVFLPSHPLERKLKIALFVGGTVVSVLVLTATRLPFLGPVGDLLDLLIRHWELLMGASDNVLPAVGKTIQELRILPVPKLAVHSSGSIVGFIVSIIGLVLLFRDKPALALFAGLPFFLMGLPSLWVKRFYIFMIPSAAIGGTYAIMYLYALVKEQAEKKEGVPSRLVALGVAGMLAAVLLVPGYKLFMESMTPPSFNGGEVGLLKAARDDTNRRFVWGWWDEGYFLQYMTKKPTFIDGGSQEPLQLFLCSAPMQSSNPEFAANWIKFFAHNGQNGFARVQGYLGADVDKTIQFFRLALQSPESARKAVALFKAGNPVNWDQFLFPDEKVYLFLRRDLLTRTQYWFQFGSYGTELQGLLPVVRDLDRKAVFFDSNEDALVIRGTNLQTKLARVVRVTRTTMDQQKLRHEDGATALIMEDSPLIYLAPAKLADSLVGQLMMSAPQTTPGFTLKSYHPYFGGLWLVE